MPVAVKICGVNSPEAFDAAVGALADYIGFVFFPPSPRFVTPAQARELSARNADGPKRVGLFVKPSDDDIQSALDDLELDFLQLYAEGARCRAIKARFGLPVWRAAGVSAAADLPQGDEALDGFVIEPHAPPAATRPGGNAVAMDYRLLNRWQRPTFWLLAGGLTVDNVAAVVGQVRPPGVDVSSGVETAPGRKSPELIARFIDAARRGTQA